MTLKSITVEEVDKLLQKHSDWGLKEGGERLYILSKDFSNLDLSNRNFSGAGLIGKFNKTKLTNCDLSYSFLMNSNFTNTDFSNSDLSYCDLSSSNLKGANLSKCNLTGTCFKYCDLENTNFKDSIISKDTYFFGISNIDRATDIPIGVITMEEKVTFSEINTVMSNALCSYIPDYKKIHLFGYSPARRNYYQIEDSVKNYIKDFYTSSIYDKIKTLYSEGNLIINSNRKLEANKLFI